MKKVSVVIPVHNSSKYIYECIKSVIDQTYNYFEIIVVDDHSTDETIDIIKSFNSKKIKIFYLKKRYGAGNARNMGVKKASGEYICFLDSDDYFEKDKLEKQVNFINNKVFIYGGYVYLKKGRKHRAHVPLSITYEEALKNTTIFTSTVMFNMKYLDKEDIYMSSVKRGQDTLTWWKVLKKIDRAYGIDDVLSIYRVGNKSLSSNKIKALKRTWDLYKIENITHFKKIYCFLCYIKNAIKRRI